MIHEKKIEKYIEKAIELLDKKYHLPNEGFLAGGSLSNTIWKLSGGEKAIINDIDIFTFNKTEDKLGDYHFRRYNERKSESNLDEATDVSDYSDVMYTDSKENEYICFNREERDEIFNYITLDSNLTEKEYPNIFKSFDINSCQVGYDLKNKKPYYTPEFEEFIETRELKVVNIMSPSNTVCRLLKKERELGNCILNDLEFLILKYSYSSRGKKRLFLGSKFFEIYEENKDKIERFFKLQKTKSYSQKEITTLIPKEWKINEGKFIFHYNEKEWYTEKKNRFEIFLKNNKRYIKKEDIIYFCRNILNDKYKRKLWVEVPQYFNNLDYLKGIDNLEECINVLWLHCKDIRQIIREPENRHSWNSTQERIIIFKDMTLLEQINVKNFLKQKINEDEKNDYLLDFIEHPLKYDNEDDLNFVFQTLRIKYRKKIHERMNAGKQDVGLPF
jgi:hypothetical protein